ncbi:MAG: 23S rRNA (adenine(2503)-C(2))-methyltransferase RlmN [Planctomycetes bacterium]|nr:23S rRNA (adenine(2503)-C(2))-methyltransferase RlmN [Planctomycetota bacterium]
MVHLTDLDDAALCAVVEACGGLPFQARQLAHWIYVHGAEDLAQCRNLPAALRASLGAAGHVLRSTRRLHETASDDGTRKLLLGLADGETVETVLIPEGERNTLCISTQVGCPVGCVFCASGLGGVKRNLGCGEIVEQVLHGRALLAPGARLTNLVVMGMGEPLLNLRNLLPALERIHDPAGIHLGARRITVSTSGLPERMREFAAAPHAYNLAVSLHAADDALRRRLVPTARAPVAAIVAAALEYFRTKGREVTFEVVLLAGVNDRPEDAAALVRVLGHQPCTVNLIPWNPVEEIAGYARPADAQVDGFAERLRTGGVKVTVRRQRGADRDAACGQLRLRGPDGSRRTG